MLCVYGCLHCFTFDWWKPLQLLLLQPRWSFIASLLSGITRYSSYTSVADPDQYVFQEALMSFSRKCHFKTQSGCQTGSLPLGSLFY